MEYKKITEVELIEEPSENAAVLAEDNGKLRRVPFKNVGGGLPAVGAPHQMLVTDADGKTVWAERTHWAEEVAKTLVDNATLDATSTQQFQNPFSAALEEGKAYTVTFNSTQYDLVASFVKMEGMSMVYVGDLSLAVYDGSVASTGEPFLIGYVQSADMIMVATKEKGVHTISIATQAVEYHRLPNEYLGSSVPVMREIMLPIMPEETNDGFTASSSNTAIYFAKATNTAALEIGKMYDVWFDGVLYPAVRSVDYYGYAAVGNAFLIAGSIEQVSKFPFCICIQGSTHYVYTTLEGTTHTFKIERAVYAFESVSLLSPNGTVFNVTVADDGTLSATAI